MSDAQLAMETLTKDQQMGLWDCPIEPCEPPDWFYDDVPSIRGEVLCYQWDCPLPERPFF